MSENSKKLLFIVNVDTFLISHRLEIALEAINEGFEVHFAAKDTGKMKEIQDLGIFTHPIRIHRSSISLKSLFQTLIDIKSLIINLKPQIVHLVSIKPVILGGILLHFFKKKPFMISSISGLGQIYISKGLFSKLKKSLTNILYRLAFCHKNLNVIFQNSNDLEYLCSVTGLKKNKTRLISGSGVDLNKFKLTKLPDLGKPIILFPGRIIVSKGVLNFVEAAKVLGEKAKFVICGEIDFESKDHISKELLNKWIDKKFIEYWGFSKNMHEIMQKSSIIILPSYREGLPKSLCEAAACGRPVITTDVPGCRDAIIPNKTGLLISLKNSNQLIEKIKILINDKKIMRRMSINGRKLAESKFDIIKVKKEHLAIYKNFI